MPAPDQKTNVQTALKGDLAVRFATISNELEAVKICIADQLVAGSESVDAQLEYVASAMGKMVRPALVLLSGKCCGELSDEHIQVASIIEMVHMATLLHDDVIDHADSRRSMETPNSRWGNESAVLLGDFLLSKAFAMSARLKGMRVSTVLADTAIRICKGELQQNAQRDNWRLTEKEYFEIIESKTACLFGSSCQLGAIAAGADDETMNAFYEFGTCLGVAFQIADDLIDIRGVETGEGKTLGRDIAEKKPTLPLIHLIGTLDSKNADELIADLSAGRVPDEYGQILVNSGSIEYSRDVAKDYCQKAISCLDVVGNRKEKKMLADIVQVVMDRAVSN